MVNAGANLDLIPDLERLAHIVLIAAIEHLRSYVGLTDAEVEGVDMQYTCTGCQAHARRNDPRPRPAPDKVSASQVGGTGSRGGETERVAGEWPGYCKRV